MDPKKNPVGASTLLLRTIFLTLTLTLTLSPSPFVLSLEEPSYGQKLLAWSRQLHEARASVLDRDAATSSSDDPIAVLQPLLDLTSSQWRDVIAEAASSMAGHMGGDDYVERMLVGEAGGKGDGEEPVVTNTASGQNETLELCVNHTLAALFSGQQWALHMADAMGKPSHGIALGNLLWPGGYTQCMNVRANTTVVSHPFFSGQYCTVATMKPDPMALGSTSFLVSLGVCVPDTCSSHDIEVMLSFVLELLNVTSPQIKPFVTCAETRPINAKAVVAIVICSIILCLMVAGTVVDIVFIQRPQWAMKQMQGDDSTEDNINGPVHQNPEHELLLPKTQTKAAMPQLGTVGKVLVSFSVYTNGEKLLSTKQAPGSLTCVHGIRFLSISWVVLGHTWAFPGSVGMNVIPYLQDLTSKWTYQAITNATVSVDTFFVLSGLLVAYLTLKEMKKRGGKLNWFLFYFHRFWRLTPAYMLCLMVYTCLAPYWGDGPFWPSKFQDEDFCADNWWTNLLYINNFVNTKEACFGHSWYLANDMQFYILSPLIFVPLFFFPVLGVVVAGAFLLVTAIVPGVLSQQHGFPAGLLQPVEGLDPMNSSSVTMDYMDIYYFKPYNRMGPYIIGLLAGYFLYRTDCKLRISWLVNAVLWALATACALAVLFGLSDDSYTNPVTVPVAAFYNAVSRTVWGACVAWVVIACVTGNGGFVNTILSWSAFVPVSRLSYCIYLLHIMVIMLYVMNRRATIFFDDVNLVFLYLGSLVASCVVAFVASLAFESPMMGLERVFLRPSSSSASPKRGGEKQ